MYIKDYDCQELALEVGIETTNKYENFSKIRNRVSSVKSNFKAVSKLSKIAENYNKSFRLIQKEYDIYKCYLRVKIPVDFDLWCDKDIGITKCINDATDRINKIIPSILVVFSPPKFLYINACRYLNYNQPYSELMWTKKTGLTEVKLEQWVKTLNRKKQMIFQGPPGTGKTFIAKEIAQYLIGGNDGFSELVQFHPAYTYEDFMQGVRPQTNKDGQLTYSMVPGRFLEFCKKAKSCEGKCILIIDEINRANLSQVFGELMYLLEYRDEKIHLAGSNEQFEIPSNVYIIGTMNTADRSIALVDYALRRRFAFITLSPDYDVLRHYQRHYGFDRDANNFIKLKEVIKLEKLIKTFKNLNQQINDPHYELGISFFLVEDLDEAIEDIWTMEVEPYLEEYFYDNPEKIEKFRWDRIKNNILNENVME